MNADNYKNKMTLEECITELMIGMGWARTILNKDKQPEVSFNRILNDEETEFLVLKAKQMQKEIALKKKNKIETIPLY
jgi:hypothetical protein